MEDQRRAREPPEQVTDVELRVDTERSTSRGRAGGGPQVPSPPSTVALVAGDARVCLGPPLPRGPASIHPTQDLVQMLSGPSPGVVSRTHAPGERSVRNQRRGA